MTATAPLTLTLTWKPGTMHLVRFTHLGQRHTVRLDSIHRAGVHSLGGLYLRGSVTLPVTWRHLHWLMRQTYSARAALERWEDEGGRAS